MTPSTIPAFIDVLHADGPAEDRTDKLALYGWLVGSWDMDVAAYEPDGTKHSGRGEIHAGWVLQGRAIQDVWMIPRRFEQWANAPSLPVAGNWYGTTLRIYDPGIDAWHILWSDPATQRYVQQIGRASGKDILQEGKLASGAVSRWRFTDIAPDSFHWIGEHSSDEGASWHLQVDIIAHRAHMA
jgi:hypothetical protein